MMLIISSLFILFLQSSLAKPSSSCPPSSCGIIPNISSPFRLVDDPTNCGDRRFELACENNVTSVYLSSHKYYVKHINYESQTIRLVDASINNHDACSFPSSSAYAYNFTYSYPRPYEVLDETWPISFMSCPTDELMKMNSSVFTDITHDCASSFSSKPHPRFTYVMVGHMNASEVPETCRVEVIVMTSFKFKNSKHNLSLSDIHHSLLYGFELYFCPDCVLILNPVSFWDQFILFLSELLWILLCAVGLLCAWVSVPVMTIVGFTALAGLLYFTAVRHFAILRSFIFPDIPMPVIELIILAPKVIIFPFALCFLIYKFRRRKLSAYNTIEKFLQSDNKLMPIKYSYSDIKKITRNFKVKLGEGGYGSVYKGKLRSGFDVAVKILGKSGVNGQDFMNEISTIGRVHHVNVVKLVGYCAQGTKRALVFDFMSNGSLEKFLFNRETMNSLNWDTKFGIAVGIARGIEYLHIGCDIQILHFDIKPHNVLLDDKFVPKISDFGLAKFCSTDKNTVTMTAARGTIGYVAPELINRGIGPISYKADVYSFGMLLMEMVNLNRYLKGNSCDSSQYFPNWIYDRFNEGRDIEIENANENDSTRKLARKITLVALWCIQMSPDDRPPMKKVLEMLEGDVQLLQIPAYPSMTSTHIELNVDQSVSACSIGSLSLLPR